MDEWEIKQSFAFCFLLKLWLFRVWYMMWYIQYMKASSILDSSTLFAPSQVSVIKMFCYWLQAEIHLSWSEMKLVSWRAFELILLLISLLYLSLSLAGLLKKDEEWWKLWSTFRNDCEVSYRFRGPFEEEALVIFLQRTEEIKLETVLLSSRKLRQLCSSCWSHQMRFYPSSEVISS